MSELLTTFLFTTAVISAIPFDRKSPKGELYAVLVAGSYGWYNYRHQADVAHAYHILLDHGVPAENIFVMMFDDIADHPKNPYRGKLFNHPNGSDVYAGLKIDYKGGSVNSENFLAVLKGDKDAVKGGNGRVIESTEDDRIFVYFSDHGSIGLIAFPDDHLTAKRLNHALKEMHENHKFGQLVFYLEACESGSMFNTLLKNDMNIYAITAANGVESSYATYCGNDLNLPCLGDEFSVNWMEDSDRQDITLETLDEQFEMVKELTLESHVVHYGNLSIADEPVSWFQGSREDVFMTSKSNGMPRHHRISWPSRDVELLYLQKMRLLGAQSLSATVDHEITRIKEERHKVEEVFTNLVNHLVADETERMLYEPLIRSALISISTTMPLRI
uniref:legumain n=1 Tax=Haemonchus contortus TaxID=6289 RepID=A0A7I4YU17_HAECO